MSSAALLNGLGKEATDLLGSMASRHRQEQRQKNEEAARTARGALSKFPRVTREIKEADAKVASAVAAKASAEAELAKRKAELAVLETEAWRLKQEHAQQLERLRHASMTDHEYREALDLLTERVDELRASGLMGYGAAIIAVSKAIQQLNAMRGAAEDPVDSPVNWARDVLDRADVLAAEGLATHTQKQAEAEKRRRADRLLNG